MKEVKFIAFYDVSNSEEKRNVSLAATSKLDYLLKTIDGLGYEISVISASNTIGKKSIKKKKMSIFSNSSLLFFNSIGTSNKFFRKLSNLYYKLQLYIYLLRNIKEEDVVIVYHSLLYMNFIKLLKKIKKFHFILEAEEIYGDVKNNKRIAKKELRFFKSADRYLFPTELMNKRIDNNLKPYIICHGVYSLEQILTEKFNDGRLHCVYAGTFDHNKGGAQMAVKTALFLNSNYHLHILGFGGSEDTNNLISLIKDTQLKTKCCISFEGKKTGSEYIKFLQQCHVGLSTQTSIGDYNDSSFPSKVLSYLSNGLAVVSIKIPVVVTSAIADCVEMYDSNDPKSVATAIINAGINKVGLGRDRIIQLDKEIKPHLNDLLIFERNE